MPDPHLQKVYAEIARVCPSARIIFSAENQILPPSRLATDFANHLLEAFRAGHTEEFPSLAILIERCYRLQNDKARDWATLGLLEAIHSVWSAGEVGTEFFRRYLLTQSAGDWDKLDRYWQHNDLNKSNLY